MARGLGGRRGQSEKGRGHDQDQVSEVSRAEAVTARQPGGPRPRPGTLHALHAPRARAGGRRHPRGAGRHHRRGGKHGARHGAASALGRPAAARARGPRRAARAAREGLSRPLSRMARSIARAAEGRFAGMLVVLAVAALTCLVFLPALDGRFLPWDDESNLVANRAWRGLGPSQLGWMLTSFHKGHWIPVTWLSFAVDYLVWGMDPRGYHLTNVLIHGANAGLVCLLVMRLLETASGVGGTARLAGAAAAALAFALHPLRVESVAWVTERRDVLSAFFFLLAIIAYLRAVREESLWRSGWSWLALGAFALSLGSKSMAESLPVVLLVLDAYPLGRVSTGAW